MAELRKTPGHSVHDIEVLLDESTAARLKQIAKEKGVTEECLASYAIADECLAYFRFREDDPGIIK